MRPLAQRASMSRTRSAMPLPASPVSYCSSSWSFASRRRCNDRLPPSSPMGNLLGVGVAGQNLCGDCRWSAAAASGYFRAVRATSK